MKHGTVHAYRRHLAAGDQPCAACRAANADAQRTYQRRRGRIHRSEYLSTVQAKHGTESRYRRGCRCDPCCSAKADVRRRQELRCVSLDRFLARDRGLLGVPAYMVEWQDPTADAALERLAS